MATTAPVIHEIPDWETPSAKLKKPIFSKASIFSIIKTADPALPLTKEEVPENEVGSIGRTWSDKWLPHWAGRIGRSRKIFFCSLAALVFLLALVLGLGLGLGLSHKLSVNLNTFHPGTAI
jgi:hypothetical protein